MHYDFLLAGATGQIGRFLHPFLTLYGDVFLLTREFLDSGAPLPTARHIVNTAGYTKFNHEVQHYWYDNVRLAVRLATAAKDMNAQYHQLSSEAVAEFRQSQMSEYESIPTASPKMIDYAMSKVLTELAVRSVLPSNQLSVYRCSDVVPPEISMGSEWRNNHWLSILFSAGKRGFSPPDEFKVWIALTSDIAEAISVLIEDGGPRTYHLLGHKYTWKTFFDSALSVEVSPGVLKLVDKVTPVIRIDPPLSDCIESGITDQILSQLDFVWRKLDETYWNQYAKLAVENSKKLKEKDHA